MTRLTLSRWEQGIVDEFQRELDALEQDIRFPAYAERIDPYVIETVQGKTSFRFIVFNHNSEAWYGDPNKVEGCFRLMDELRYVQPDDVVLDLGCNTGFTTSYFAMKTRGVGHVHAVDPFPWNTLAAKYQCKINGLNNCTTHCIAIGDVSSRLRISLADAQSLPSDSDWAVESPMEPVSFFDAMSPTLIKIDVEGAEHEMFAGWAQHAPKSCATVDRIFMEFHGQFIGGRDVDPSLTFENIDRLGFTTRFGHPAGQLVAADQVMTTPNWPTGSFYITR